MGYLGFDPSRLRSLVGAAQGAVDELTMVRQRLDDPLAADARMRLRRAATSLETWVQRIASITTCSALTSYRPVGPSPDDLRTATTTIAALHIGWSIVTDDRAEIALTAAERLVAALALARTFAAGSLKKLLDSPEELASLSASLRWIAADPTLSSAFFNEVPPEQFAKLTESLARLHSRAVIDSDPTAQARIESILISLGSVISKSIPADRFRTVLDATDPYAAALLLRSLTVTGDQLGGLAAALLIRQDSMVYDAERIMQADRGYGLGLGDLLFPTILATPGASKALLLATSHNAAVVVHAATDLTLVPSLYRAATVPGTLAADEAGTIIIGLLRVDPEKYLLGNPLLNSDRAWLSEIVAPWLFEFVPPARSDWPWAGDEEAMSQLERLGGDDVLFEALGQRLGALQAATVHATALTDGRLDVDYLNQLANVTILITALLNARKWSEVEDAKERERQFDLAANVVWGVADVGLAFVALPTGVGPIWAVSNASASGPINDQLKGLLGLPDPHDVLRRGDYAVELALVGLAATAIARFASALGLPADRLPPLAPTPNDDGTAIERPMERYHEQLVEWANTLPNGQSVDARVLIETTVNGGFATYLAQNAEH